MTTRFKLLADFQHYWPEMAAYLTKSTGAREDAEDILQELSLRLMKLAPSHLASIDETRAYLYRSANNMKIDYYRKTVTRTKGLSELQAAGIDSRSYTTHEVVENREMLEKLFEIVNELPLRCKQVFLLYRLRNLSQKDIAKDLGVSVNMVEKHIMKAHLYLHERMNEENWL